MFGAVSSYSSFTCETNPAYLTIGSTERDGKSESGAQQRVKRTFLVHSGQSLNDMWKYLPSPPATRLTLAESTLRWRHIAPTAPDTLWCHPYFTADPFIIEQTPDVYVIGDQPRLQTKMVVDSKEVGGSKRCRVILVPRFAETGILVLANLRTLGVRGVQFGVEGMGGEVAMAES
jgi:DNA polymerase delta subunit 2